MVLIINDLYIQNAEQVPNFYLFQYNNIILLVVFKICYNSAFELLSARKQ